MAKQKKQTSTKKREPVSEHPFDERAKTFYTQHHQNMKLRSGRQFEVYSRARSIDVLTECTDEERQILNDTCFAHYQRVNSLELKGPHDALTPTDLTQILSRSWGISGKDRVEKKDEGNVEFLSKETIQEIAEDPTLRTITILCVTRPDNILDSPKLKKGYDFKETDESGVYLSGKLAIPTRIIHPDELDLVPKNYPLLTLARGKKLQQFVEICIEKKMDYYLQFIADIIPTMESSEIFVRLVEVFRMNVMTIEPQTITYFNQMLADIPELMQLSAIQDFMASEKKRAELRSEQKMLIRQLYRKFEDVPDDVIELIESTTESYLIEEWSLEILTADSWEEIFPDIEP